MKTVEEQLARYRSVHFNKKNIATHFIGIPLIIWAVTILMSVELIQLPFQGMNISISYAEVCFSLLLIYYIKLHWRLALGMLVFMLTNLYLANLLINTMDNTHLFAVGVFILGWIIQFIGHYYEQAKPAFFDDLSQFAIGPLFLMAEIYFALHWEGKLNHEVNQRAKNKRHLLEQAKQTTIT